MPEMQAFVRKEPSDSVLTATTNLYWFSVDAIVDLATETEEV
jgi:hypothetical protein